MCRVPLSAELSAYVAARITAYADEAPKLEGPQSQTPFVAELRVLPLHLGWGETLALTIDGRFVSYSEDCDYPGTKPVDDPRWALAALVDATDRYPGLQA